MTADNWVENKTKRLETALEKYAGSIGVSGVLELMLDGYVVHRPEGLTPEWAKEIADKWLKRQIDSGELFDLS